MPSFLPICILLIGQLFSSSATYLPTIRSEIDLASANSSRIKSLTASQVESAVSRIESAVKASNSNITKLATYLDGYVSDVMYSDYTCKNFLYAYSRALNTCWRSSATRFSYVIATTTEVIAATFSDEKCSLDLQLTSSTTYVNKQCTYFGYAALFVFEGSEVQHRADTTIQR